MDHTLYTFKRPKPTTLSARAARAIHCSRTLSSGALVLAIGLACLGLGVLTPTKATIQAPSQPTGEHRVNMPMTLQRAQPLGTSTWAQYFLLAYQQLKASTSTKADIKKQDSQPTEGRYDETTVATATFGQEAMEVSKIVLISAMNGFIWTTILNLISSKTHFPERLLESITLGSIIGMPLSTILGAIWGVIARCHKNKMGWRDLIWPVTIFLGIVTAAVYIRIYVPKDSIPVTILFCGVLLCIFVIGPFLMKRAILDLTQRPPRCQRDALS